jgi:hypothetical protein
MAAQYGASAKNSMAGQEKGWGGRYPGIGFFMPLELDEIIGVGHAVVKGYFYGITPIGQTAQAHRGLRSLHLKVNLLHLSGHVKNINNLFAP